MDAPLPVISAHLPDQAAQLAEFSTQSQSILYDNLDRQARRRRHSRFIYDPLLPSRQKVDTNPESDPASFFSYSAPNGIGKLFEEAQHYFARAHELEAQSKGLKRRNGLLREAAKLRRHGRELQRKTKGAATFQMAQSMSDGPVKYSTSFWQSETVDQATSGAELYSQAHNVSDAPWFRVSQGLIERGFQLAPNFSPGILETPDDMSMGGLPAANWTDHDWFEETMSERAQIPQVGAGASLGDYELGFEHQLVPIQVTIGTNADGYAFFRWEMDTAGSENEDHDSEDEATFDLPIEEPEITDVGLDEALSGDEPDSVCNTDFNALGPIERNNVRQNLQVTDGEQQLMSDPLSLHRIDEQSQLIGHAADQGPGAERHDRNVQDSQPSRSATQVSDLGDEQAEPSEPIWNSAREHQSRMVELKYFESGTPVSMMCDLEEALRLAAECHQREAQANLNVTPRAVSVGYYQWLDEFQSEEMSRNITLEKHVPDHMSAVVNQIRCPPAKWFSKLLSKKSGKSLVVLKLRELSQEFPEHFANANPGVVMLKPESPLRLFDRRAMNLPEWLWRLVTTPKDQIILPRWEYFYGSSLDFEECKKSKRSKKLREYHSAMSIVPPWIWSAQDNMNAIALRSKMLRFKTCVEGWSV